jgi:hypothetical protein
LEMPPRSAISQSVFSRSNESPLRLKSSSYMTDWRYDMRNAHWIGNPASVR